RAEGARHPRPGETGDARDEDAHRDKTTRRAPGGSTTPPPTPGGSTTPPPTPGGSATPPPTPGGSATPPARPGGSLDPSVAVLEPYDVVELGGRHLEDVRVDERAHAMARPRWDVPAVAGTEPHGRARLVSVTDLELERTRE